MGKRVCVIGAGRWGKNHIKTLAGLGHLAGIVETNPDTLRAFQEAYPGVRTFPSVHEAVEEEFDGFTIATPAETHDEIAETVLNHRKHVLVEKPLSLTAARARKLNELAKRNGVNLMVGHVLLFHPAIRKIKELIEQGRIGKLEYLYTNRVNLGTVRTEENILWSFAVHDICIFQYLIGLTPTGVQSTGGAFLQPHIHDTTLTVLSYPGNIVGHVFVSWLHPFKEHRLVVIGSKGMFSFEDSSESKDILFFEKGIDWVRGEPIKRDGPTEIIPYEREMPLTVELSYFVDHLDGSPIDTAGGSNAIEVLEILERASVDLLGKPLGQEECGTPKTPDFFVHPSSYVDEDVEIESGSKVWHFSHVQSGAKIGSKCSIGQNVNIGNNVRIGNAVKIQNNVSVYEGVELEDYVFCGPSMVFTNVMDPRSKYPQRGAAFYHKTLVKEGASIGANATIVCGNTIGRHAFIAAGATVIKDVPDYALMAGVPAVRKGWVCECGQSLGHVEKHITCSRCNLGYQMKDGILVLSHRT